MGSGYGSGYNSAAAVADKPSGRGDNPLGRRSTAFAAVPAAAVLAESLPAVCCCNGWPNQFRLCAIYANGNCLWLSIHALSTLISFDIVIVIQMPSTGCPVCASIFHLPFCHLFAANLKSSVSSQAFIIAFDMHSADSKHFFISIFSHILCKLQCCSKKTNTHKPIIRLELEPNFYADVNSVIPKVNQKNVNRVNKKKMNLRAPSSVGIIRWHSQFQMYQKLPHTIMNLNLCHAKYWIRFNMLGLCE